MSDLKELAKKFRDGGNTYQDYRMILFKPEELKAYADLLDPPPRFTEAQMAFLRGLYAIGVRTFKHNYDSGTMLDAFGKTIAPDFIKAGETLDLVELLWKDAT